MWRPSNLRSHPAPNPSTLFAAQAWHELLSPHSPDTFQARALDLPTLLEEVTEVANLSSEDERWRAHLPMVADELHECRQAEHSYLSTDLRLRTSIDDVIGTIRSGQEPVRVVHERAQVALGLFGSVQRRWRHDAIGIAHNNLREKELFLHRLSTLATHVLNRGLEDETVALVTMEACGEDPDAFVDHITACLSDDSHNFHCVIALDGPRGDLGAIVNDTQFRQVGKGTGIRQDTVSREWHTSFDGRFFISITRSALSRRLAAETCLQEIATLLNVQNLYHNSAAFRVATRVLVYDDDYTPSVLEVNPARQFALFPRSHHRAFTRQTYSQVGHRLIGRISNALECHALALSADDPKTAMINLWTALETMTGAMGAKPIGTRVAERISPIIAHRRVDKIATYLALSIYELIRQDGNAPIDRNLMPNSGAQYIAPDDVLHALTGRDSNPAIKYLLSRCADSPLLLYRLFRAWRELHDSNNLARSMAGSRRRIEWQINRIYRARNLLVHRGEESRYLWRLLRNAQYYVSSAISRVLHDLRDQSRWTVDTSLENQLQRYDYLYERLSNHAGAGVKYSDLLVRNTSRSESTVWP
jgi:hypothetical protein